MAFKILFVGTKSLSRCIPFLKGMDRLLIHNNAKRNNFIFHLPIRYCSLELQKTIVRCSHENIRIHPVFKDYRLIVSIVNSQ